MTTKIINGKIILPDDDGNFFVAEKSAITFDEKILDFNANTHADKIIDAENNFVSPGFINIHIHGCNGFDVMDDSPDAILEIKKFLPSTGVTSFLPTTMTMTIEQIKNALSNVRSAMKNFDGAKIIGANLEGPFISKKFKGSQEEKNIIPADFNFVAEFADTIKILTVAPEELENFEFIKKCCEKNIIVSIGHSAASYEIALDAIKNGATHITHFFNAQSGLHHRKPGIVGAAFNANVFVELITDNVHVHPAVQKIVYKLKPHEEIILITDSLRACGLGDGESELGGHKVFIKNNVATLADGTLAASVIKMNDGVKNFRENTGASVAEVVEFVTKNPARELKIYDKVGSLEVGKFADIIIFDDEFKIKSAFVNGKKIKGS